MPVSDHKMIQKMIHELEKAAAHIDQPSRMREHIRAVQLLAELLLEDGLENSTKDQDVLAKVKESQGKQENHEPIDHDGANGESIFDF
ncbi:MAG: YwdI family protein [Bacillaceae bacterium]|nr:YwdI family protein [Bacillaceae bacterium]